MRNEIFLSLLLGFLHLLGGSVGFGVSSASSSAATYASGSNERIAVALELFAGGGCTFLHGLGIDSDAFLNLGLSVGDGFRQVVLFLLLFVQFGYIKPLHGVPITIHVGMYLVAIVGLVALYILDESGIFVEGCLSVL